jgi:hypothetical protein
MKVALKPPEVLEPSGFYLKQERTRVLFEGSRRAFYGTTEDEKKESRGKRQTRTKTTRQTTYQDNDESGKARQKTSQDQWQAKPKTRMKHKKRQG